MDYLQQLRDSKCFGNVKPAEKKIKPIAKMSAKRKVVQKEYRKIVSEVLGKDNKCKIGAPGCTKIASGMHHAQKRSPKNLTKRTNLIPSCSSCNLWVELNSKEAKKKGFTISRFKKDI